MIVLTFAACATKKAPKDEFTVDMDTPQIELGEIEAQFEKLLAVAGLRKARIAVSYYPTEDAVCLQYKSELITYNQFWNYDGREAFINALKQYTEDYNARRLKKSGIKTLKQYDIVKGYLIWQLHRFAIKAKANMNVELGYYFKNNSPYFTVNQREALYIDPIGRDNNRDTQTIAIYFTRAQAIELAALFDSEFINELNMKKIEPERKSTVADKDDYLNDGYPKNVNPKDDYPKDDYSNDDYPNDDYSSDDYPSDDYPMNR
jgi:hypothetical protein